MTNKSQETGHILEKVCNCIDEIIDLTEEHEESDEERSFICQKLTEARSLFEKSGNDNYTSDELLKLGWLDFHTAQYMPDRTMVKSQLELAISSLEKALLAIDSVQETNLSIEGYLLAIECYSHLSRYQPEITDREDCLTKSLNIANTCMFLCFQTNNTSQLAKLTYLMARTNGEYYQTDRDSNLLDAIRYAELSIAIMQNDRQRHPISIPTLYNDIGNFYAKLSGDRNSNITKAQASYQKGLHYVDLKRSPRLHAALNNNAQWIDSILNQNVTDLPTPEMVLRYKTKIQQCIKQSDLDQALQIGWAYLQWSWSLPQTPNASTADAHLVIGNVNALKFGNSQAINHYFSALVIASCENVDIPERPLFLSQTKDALVNALTQLSQPQSTIEAYLQSAASAVDTSYELVNKSEQLAENDLQAALDTAIEAANWYPFNPYTYFYQGISFLRAGNFAYAQQAFTQSININPNDKLSWLNRGLCYRRLNEFDLAIKDFEKTLTLDANLNLAMNQIIETYVQTEQYGQCIEKLDQFITRFPQQGEFFQWRSYCYEKTDRRENAIKDLSNAIELCNDEQLKPKLEKTLESLKQPEPAV